MAVNGEFCEVESLAAIYRFPYKNELFQLNNGICDCQSVIGQGLVSQQWRVFENVKKEE